MAEKRIYVIVSNTSSVLSKLISKATHSRYSHVSIGFEEEPSVMFSFARRHAYNPLCGGFVKESPDFGTFKRFKKAEAVVCAIDVDESTYLEIRRYVYAMYERKEKYGYNYVALVTALFDKNHKSKNRYTCTEFVSEVLEKFGVVSENFLPACAKPKDFFELFRDKIIYEGKMKDLPRTPDAMLLAG